MHFCDALHIQDVVEAFYREQRKGIKVLLFPYSICNVFLVSVNPVKLGCLRKSLSLSYMSNRSVTTVEWFSADQP